MTSAALSLSEVPHINEPLDSDDDDILINSCLATEDGETDLQSVLKEMEKKMSKEKEKVKVDEEDLLNVLHKYLSTCR